jgi:hypothetical protein
MEVTGVLPAVYMNTWKEPPTTVPQRCAKKEGGGDRNGEAMREIE